MSVAIKLPWKDSNPHRRNQNPTCYHYTTRQCVAGLLPFCECKVRHYFWIVQIFGKNFYKKIFFLACGVESAGPNRRLGVGAVGAFLGGALPFEGVKNGVKLRGGEKNWQNLWIIENFGVTLHRKTEGRLAQLVQSVCLTSRGSGVRIPQRPPPHDRVFDDSVFFLCRGRGPVVCDLPVWGKDRIFADKSVL